MRRTFTFAVVAAALCALRVVLATSESAAEPILGEESLTGPSSAAIQRPETADALSLFKAGDYDGALTLWKDAARRNSDLPPAQLIMAQLYFQSRMPKEGHRALEQAAADAPNDPEVYLLMAGVALGEKDFSKANSLLQKAKDLLPGFTKSVKRKARLALQTQGGMVAVAEARGDWAASQTVLEEWLKQDAKNTGLMQRLAFCLLKQKKPEDALERLREAAKLDPKMLPPETVLAQLCRRTGAPEDAKKWMKTALTAAPKDIGTRLLASQWALDVGDLNEARDQAVAAARIDPKSFDAKVLQGTIAVFERNYLAAELFFDSALKHSPNNLAVSNNLALVLIEQKEESKNRRAMELAEANMKRYPNVAEVASTYGLVLFRLGKLDDAEKVLRVAAPIASTDLDTAYALALVAIERGRKPEAKQLLEAGLKNVKAAMFRRDAQELLEQLKKGP